MIVERNNDVLMKSWRDYEGSGDSNEGEGDIGD